MRLGVAGGTFDPIHIGHLILAEAAREQLSLQRVLFLPAGQPWRKAERKITPGEHRLAMLRLALEGTGFELSSLEIDRVGPSYTSDTLEALAADNPGAELFFIGGYDALLDLPRWKNPQRILELATLAVAARRDREAVEPDAVEALLPGSSARVVALAMPVIEISASAIRQRVSQGRSIRFLVPERVAAYIQDQGLYR